MATEADICNAAMTKLGAQRVTAAFLTAPTNEAERLCAERYATIRDAELQANAWRFARTRTSLAAHGSAPAFGWTNAFVLPGNFLKLLALNENDPWQWYFAPDWGIENHQGVLCIMTDYSEPLKVLYVAQATDPALMHPLFQEALASRIAEELAPRLCADPNRQGEARNMYFRALEQAALADALDAPPEQWAEDTWVTVRG